MSADYGPAIWLPSPGRYWHGRNGDKPRYIILHGTAGGTSAQAIGNWLNTQTEREATSVHYVIGQDGAVVQLVSESDSAWGNGVLSAGHDSWWTGNPNWYTISIEHCKPNIDNSDALTPAQRDASFALVRHLCEKWGIPKHAADATGGITGHKSIDPVERAFCPGVFPWDALFAYLGGGTVAGVPSGWHDSANGDTSQNGTLTAPNGKVVTSGFRHWILTHEWIASDVPLDADHSEQGGSRIDFRISVLEWNATRNIITQHDRADELVQQIAALQAEVATLQASQANPAEHQALVQIKAIADGVQ